MESTLNEAESAETWNQIAPLLDGALEKLGQKDHDALVLRFFENKTFAEVGVTLGASEDAAKMRVNRALEKLRKIFTKRGVSSTTAIIAGTISANSVQAAPVALAKSVTAVAIAKGAAASASTLTLIKGALKIMAWTKVKTGMTAGIVVLAVGLFGVMWHRPMQNQEATSNAGGFWKSTTYPTVVLTLGWDGTKIAYPDTAVILPALRQTPAYRAWRHDDHIFAGTNSGGYRFEAHFMGMGTLDGKPKEIIQDVRILRPDNSLLAYTAGPEGQRWDVKIYDETGTNVTTRLQWERTAQTPNGFVSRVVHNPGTPKELMWFVNRFGVVYSDALAHTAEKYRDAPYP